MLSYIKEVLFGEKARSPEWPKFRREFLKKNPTCAACGTKNKLEVHHILPFHVYPNLELSENNCITLCNTGGGCHITFGHLQDWDSWNIHVQEDAKNYLLRVQTRPFMRK